MPGFKTTLSIERAVKKGYWRLIKPLVYIDERGVQWTVPAGFETDGASIPRLFWRVVGHPMSDYLESAVVHDYLYSCGIVTRERADEMFEKAMQSQGIGWTRRNAMWSAVRVGGRWAYKKKQEDFVPPSWR